MHRLKLLPGRESTVMGTCLWLDFFLWPFLASLGGAVRDGCENAATVPEILVAHVLIQTNFDTTTQQSGILRLLDQMARRLIHPDARPHDSPRHRIICLPPLHVQPLEFFDAVELEDLLAHVRGPRLTELRLEQLLLVQVGQRSIGSFLPLFLSIRLSVPVLKQHHLLIPLRMISGRSEIVTTRHIHTLFELHQIELSSLPHLLLVIFVIIELRFYSVQTDLDLIVLLWVQVTECVHLGEIL